MVRIEVGNENARLYVICVTYLTLVHFREREKRKTFRLQYFVLSKQYSAGGSVGDLLFFSDSHNFTTMAAARGDYDGRLK